MKRGREENSYENSPSPTRLRHGVVIDIALDVTVEILKKLPVKSLVRFQCVSKQWSSIIGRRRDFIDSIVARSLTQPPRDAHVLCKHAVHRYKDCFIAFSSNTCPRNIDKVSSVLRIPGNMRQYVRGLIFCWSNKSNEAAIYNPTTRQSFYLPDTKPYDMASCFFGYDPFENQYKALFIPLNHMEEACKIFTLGDPTAKEWRTIQGVGYHFPMASVVSINGSIHYLAWDHDDDSASKFKLMSFDLRREKFYHVEAPKTLMDHVSTLINYQGKLGFVCCEKYMEIWVMVGVEKKTKGWSRIFFYEMEGFQKWHISGATRGGEIAFVDESYLYDDYSCLLYYDPKRNSMRYVKLEGLYPDNKYYMPTIMWTVPDHVENTLALNGWSVGSGPD